MTKEELARFLALIEMKSYWGKNEIRNLILDILAGVAKWNR